MTRLAWKRRLGSWFGREPALPRKVILLYHAVGMQPPAVMPERFLRQLAWLQQHAQVLPLADLLAVPADGLQVSISFDDGYASLHDEAAPVLLKHGMGAIVYLNTAHIGELQREVANPALGHYPAQEFLLWSEVRSLVEAGWAIGSHGVHHTDLVRAGAVRAATELKDSRQQIEQRLQRPCEHFAFTWGRYTPALQGQVRAAGYRSAASGLHGPLRADSDHYALPRIDVRADYDLEDFVAVVTGRWDWLRYSQQLAGYLR